MNHAKIGENTSIHPAHSSGALAAWWDLPPQERFRAAAFRDGAANEEGEPDILFVRDAASLQTHPREDMP